MEPHPIPQNVTSFEFRLIGDMTLKQFLYLAVGLAAAYLIFIALVPTLPLIAWPLTICSALLGVAFAFLPIADRPLDHWLKAYLKAVYSPTKAVWSKNGHDYRQEPLFEKRFLILEQNLAQPSPVLKPLPATPTDGVTLTPPPTSATTGSTPNNPPPTQEELKQTVDLARQAQELQSKIIEGEKQLAQIKNAAQNAGENAQVYTDQVNLVLENLQKLVTEASSIKQQLSAVTKESQPLKQVKVEVVKPTRPRISQPTLTSLPNVINGIVTDSTNNYLEGVVVVISDKDGLPVRALKTNKLGQFTGTTPLPNGTYTIELEKENLVFDVLQMELAGAILPPLSISAKKIVGSI